MSEVKLHAVARSEFGKGAARRIRRADQVPAVVYGHGAEPLHITLPGHETMLGLKRSNALFAIELDGKSRLAIAKDVQRDPVKNLIEHVDFLVVRKGEKIVVEVNVHVTGESYPGTIHLVETQTAHLEAEATNLPEWIEISVEGLEAGAVIRGSDLVLPEGAALVGDPEEVFVTVTVPQSTAADDEAAEELAAEQSAASAAAAEEEAVEEA